VLLTAGADDEAAALAEELAGIAESFGCAALRAAAHAARAGVALARGDAAAALPAARSAIREWALLSAIYETARFRVLVGLALRLLGDEERRRRRADGGPEVLRRPGRRAGRMRDGPAPRAGAVPRGLSPREMEVLRLVAAGNSNPQIAATLVLSEKTVARHLSNIFVRLDVGSRTAAAAFAFEHYLV